MTKSPATTVTRRRIIRPSTPLTAPLVDSTTFVLENAEAVRRYQEGHSEDFLYGRYGNPTVLDVEEVLAELDGAERALLFGSGQAASSTLLLALVQPGDEVLCSASVYGGTSHLLRDVLPRFGVNTRFVPLNLLPSLDAHFTERTRVFWFESPTNPNLRIVDIAQVATACRRRGVLSVLDNTFASPLNQQPLAMGVDLSLQSATKYLGGHSDVTAGVVAGSSSLVTRIEMARRALGGVLDPHSAHLIGRSLKTLPLRVAHQNRASLEVAQALEGAPGVVRVHHPGLSSHPEHDLAQRQMRGFGGMVCLEVEGGEAGACRAFDRLTLVSRAASLGGVESICSLPVLTSHYGQDDAQLAAAGVTRSMMRISIGLEEPADLIADLLQAVRPGA